MDWEPIFEEEVLELVSDGWFSMNAEQRAIWDTIKVIPEKWTGDNELEEDDEFWVVAVTRTHVLWYNHIVEGFNLSRYLTKGHIASYQSQQDDLEITLQHAINLGGSS